jgi:hypothetical protein
LFNEINKNELVSIPKYRMNRGMNVLLVLSFVLAAFVFLVVPSASAANVQEFKTEGTIGESLEATFNFPSTIDFGTFAIGDDNRMGCGNMINGELSVTISANVPSKVFVSSENLNGKMQYMTDAGNIPSGVYLINPLEAKVDGGSYVPASETPQEIFLSMIPMDNTKQNICLNQKISVMDPVMTGKHVEGNYAFTVEAAI